MLKRIIIFCVFIIELVSLRSWFVCSDLINKFHFSSFDVTLKIQEAISNDIGYAPLLARFFHNKLTFSINAVMASYLQFWDIRFGVMLFMLVGYFGIFCGLWYLISSKYRYKWLVFIFLLLLPFIEVFHMFQLYQLRFVLLVLPYFSVSIYGIWQFMKAHKKKVQVILIILIVSSIWYNIVFSKDIFLNCIK